MTDAPSTRPPSPGDALHGPDIATSCGGRLLRTSARAVHGAAVDSRRVSPGFVFFALPGERTDGHEYLAEAVRGGAAALVVTRPLDEDQLDALVALAPDGVSIVAVDDAGRALRALSGAWRRRFDPLVVGVTGSIAKTSTKEAVATVLATRWRVLRTLGNENNEIGLPLTLLRLDASVEVAVVEMGMYVPGEIAELATLARPRFGVVTAVRGVHLERAGSLDAIERGKRQLVQALPADGAAILNADDELVSRMAGHTAARVLRYGFAPDADVRAEEVESLGEGGMRFVLRLPDAAVPVVTAALGRHGVHNGLAAAAVGHASGLAAAEIAAGLARGWSAPHRDDLRSVGPWSILDDTYNAGPDSMAAALELLSTLPGRRVAVLGEMLELGPDGPALHRAVGAQAARRADMLVVVGQGARPLASGAIAAGMDAGMVEAVDDRGEALRLLLERLRPGDTVLVKGSRGAALDELVEALERSVPVGGAVPA